MKKVMIFSLLGLLFLAFTGAALAQVEIQKFYVHPYPSPYISDWEWNQKLANLVLFNHSYTEQTRVILAVTITRKIISRFGGQQPILTGRSEPITLRPGLNTIYSPELINWGDVEYDTRIESNIIRTGRLPQGSYTICVGVIVGKKTVGPECRDFSIIYPNPPSLILPADGDSLSTPYPNFQWTSVIVPPDYQLTYHLKICELLPHQYPSAAIRSNYPVYEDSIQSQTFFSYPLNAPALEEGKSYVWQVQAKDQYGYPVSSNQGRSEIWTFTYWPPGYQVGPEVGEEIRIGDFVVAITEVTNPSADDFSGSGTIEIPFLHQGIEVSFSGLQIDEEKKVTTGFINAAFTPPLETEADFAHLFLDSITFWPDSATCSGSLIAILPITTSGGNQLSFPLNNIRVTPQGLLGTVHLSNDLSFDLIDPMGFGLVFKSGSSISFGQGISSSIDLEVILPDNVRDKDNQTVSFQIDDIDLLGRGCYLDSLPEEVNLPPLRIGESDLALKPGDLILDLCGNQSPTGMPPGFMGVYVGSAKLALPPIFQSLSSDLPELPPIPVKVREFGIGGGGMEGYVLPPAMPPAVKYGGFGGKLDSIYLCLVNNTVDHGSIKGKITVPFLDSDVGFSIAITAEGLQNLTLTTGFHAHIEAWLMEITITGGQFSYSDGVGMVTINGRLSCHKLFVIPDIQFEGLGITSEGEIKLSGGAAWLNLTTIPPATFYGFSIGISGIGFGLYEDRRYFGVKASLTLPNPLSEADAEGIFKIFSKKVGNQWVYDGVTVGGLTIDYDRPPLKFYAEIEFYDNDPTYGSGFGAETELTIQNQFSVWAALKIGTAGPENNRFPYWYVAAKADLGFGLPFGALPVSLYGLGGGAYYHCRRADTTSTGQYQGDSEYIPDRTVGFGFKAMVILGTSSDQGYTWNGDLMFEISFTSSWGLKEIHFHGDSWLFTSRTARSDQFRIVTDIDVQTQPSFVFTAYLGVKIRYAGIVRIPASGDGFAHADMKFSADEWYFHFGTKDSPISVNALYIWVCSGYFDIDNHGIALGFREDLDTGLKRWWIFYGQLRAGFSADVAVGYRPFFIYGEVAAWLDVRAGVHVDVWFWEGDIDIINAGVAANLGVRAPNPTRVWGTVSAHYSLLGGIVSGSFSMSFSWTSEGCSAGGVGEIELPPAIVSTYPADGAEDVPLGIKLVGRFPFKAFEMRTAPTDNGDMEYFIFWDWDRTRLYRVPRPGTMVSVPYREKHLTADSTQCYFHPQYLLEPHSAYKFKIVAKMRRRYIPGGWTTVGEHVFWINFRTGDEAPRWNQYVESTYPRSGQKWVYTSSGVDVNFFARMPTGYGVSLYYMVNGEWEETTNWAPTWRNQRQRIHAEPYGGWWSPNTDRQLRVTKIGTGQEVYKLSFKTSAYKNFSQMMDNSVLAPRVGYMVSPDDPSQVVSACVFNTVEPINWEDIESITFSPTYLGQAVITAPFARNVLVIYTSGGDTLSAHLPAPVQIRANVYLKGVYDHSYYTGLKHFIYHYCDYDVLQIQPDLEAIQEWNFIDSIINAYVTDYTLSDPEKDAVWNALGQVNTHFQVFLRYRSIRSSCQGGPEPLPERTYLFNITIPKQRINHK